MSTFYKISVKEVVAETDDSVSVVLEVPESLKETFAFIPGQFITIKKTIDGVDLRRSYSICSSAKSGILKIGVKAVPGGKFSVYAVTKLLAGDILEVIPPDGRFILEPHAGNTKNYLAFAAGSGITPIMSMIKSVLEVEQNSSFVLLYGNQSPEKAMFKKEIDKLANEYPQRLFVHHAFSRTHIDNSLFGRIDTSMANFIIKNTYKNIHFDDIFLCGPEGMINLLKTHLTDSGYEKENIHFELFATPEVSDDAVVNLDGDSKITVLLDDEETVFSMPKEQTILQMALANGLDAPYSCQGGICSTCLAQVTQGKAVMDKNTILTDEEVRSGLILTCQSHPVTSTIAIDYDSV